MFHGKISRLTRHSKKERMLSIRSFLLCLVDFLARDTRGAPAGYPARAQQGETSGSRNRREERHIEAGAGLGHVRYGAGADAEARYRAAPVEIGADVSVAHYAGVHGNRLGWVGWGAHHTHERRAGHVGSFLSVFLGA